MIILTTILWVLLGFLGGLFIAFLASDSPYEIRCPDCNKNMSCAACGWPDCKDDCSC